MSIVWPDGDERLISRIRAGDRPAWSPDGRRMALTKKSEADADGGQPKLFVMDLPSGPVRELTTGSDLVAFPAWSPDGSRIAYTRGPTDLIRILVSPDANTMLIGQDGSKPHLLTHEVQGVLPSWSPDGQFVAIQGVTPTDTHTQIYAVDAATGSAHQLTSDMDGTHMHPAWSPDGRFVAYVLSPASNIAKGYLPWQLWVVKADGSGRRLLVDDAEKRFVYAPAWTPDGRIIFATEPEQEGRQARLEIVDSDGANRAVISGPLDNVVPAVAPRLAIAPPVLTDLDEDVAAPSRAAVNRGPGRDRTIASSPEVTPSPDPSAATIGAAGPGRGTAAFSAADAASAPARSARSNSGSAGRVAVILVLLLVAFGVAVKNHPTQ